MASTSCTEGRTLSPKPLISIVDDDESLRQALVGLVRSLGYRAQGYASADAFLACPDAAASDCIVTDIQMPGLSGIELKPRLINAVFYNIQNPLMMIAIDRIQRACIFNTFVFMGHPTQGKIILP